jgi:hypothetical protein
LRDPNCRTPVAGKGIVPSFAACSRMRSRVHCTVFRVEVKSAAPVWPHDLDRRVKGISRKRASAPSVTSGGSRAALDEALVLTIDRAYFKLTGGWSFDFIHCMPSPVASLASARPRCFCVDPPSWHFYQNASSVQRPPFLGDGADIIQVRLPGTSRFHQVPPPILCAKLGVQRG